jgi:hypothetical protein
MECTGVGEGSNETIQQEVMGVVGKYNCWCWFKEQAETSDTYGGIIQTLTYDYQEGTVYRVRGRLRVSKSDRMKEDDRLVQETVWNLEIRANTSWRPKKGLTVSVDDGYRVFVATIIDIKNTDGKRKYWDLQIVEVE